MSGISPKLSRALTGISGILVTPFDEQDQIAPNRLRPVVDRAVEAGVHILVANGNTSEFYGLEAHEAESMVHAVVEQVGGRASVLGGVGRGINEACKLARASARAGVDALLVHQPPDPFVSPRGVVEYVRRVSDAADGLPLMLYLRNDGIGLDAIEALTTLPNVAGVKWATPSPMKMVEAMRRASPDIIWVGGLAEVWAPAQYALGARGFTSGLINVWPERSMAIHAALDSGQYEQARHLINDISGFEEIRAMEQNGANVSGVKTALKLIGLDCGAARPPAGWPLAEAQQHQMRRMLGEWGVMPS